MKTMAAALMASSIFSASIASAGPNAQPATGGSPSMTTPAAENTGLLRQKNITSTGATVPHPGVSQGAGFTPLDHDIERLNDKIERGICKGC